MKNLVELTIDTTYVRDLSFLEDLPNLRKLEVTVCRPGETCAIGQLKHLKALSLMRCKVDMRNLVDLPELESLTLDMPNAENLQDVGLFPKLERLVLLGNWRRYTPIFDCLGSVKSLKVLDLSLCRPDRQTWEEQISPLIEEGVHVIYGRNGPTSAQGPPPDKWFIERK